MTEPKMFVSPDAGEALRKRRADLALQKATEYFKQNPIKKETPTVNKPTSDMERPGGKKLAPMANHLEALIKAGGATKAQIKQYEKMTGKKAPKQEDID